MKQRLCIFTASLILLSAAFSARGQVVNPKDKPAPVVTSPAVPKVDTTAASYDLPNDSLAFVSSLYFANYLQALKTSISVDAYSKMTPEMVVGDFFRWSIAVWNEERKARNKPATEKPKK